MYNIYSELEIIKDKYNLTGFKQQKGYIFYGNLQLNHTYNNISLINNLYISMFVPYTFPNELPIVKDITKKIDNNFHKNNDEILCLACNIEIYYELKKNSDTTICDFIEKFLIPYLYSYTYYKKYNKVPYGDRKHGSKGIIEFYIDYFNLNNDKEALNLLEYIALKKYRGHNLCPCGSKEKIRKCHGQKLRELLQIVGKDNIYNDWLNIKNEIKSIEFIQYKKKQQKKKLRYYLFPTKNKYDKYMPKYHKNILNIKHD